MGNLKPGTSLVYESPDGGKTVYSREPGSPFRTLVGYSVEKQQLLKEQQERELWDNIRKEAEKNPTLQEALERVKVLYHLSKKDGT
jgi:hypothetical protein